MSDKYTRTPEGYLASVLTLTAQDKIDVSKILEQIPEAERTKVYAVLSGLSEQAAKASAPPIVKVAKPAEVKKLVELLKLEDGFANAIETQKAFQLLKAGEKTPDFGQILKTFTPEMLATAQNFQNPTLILNTKGRSFNDLVSAMHGHKTMHVQCKVSVFDSFFQKHAAQKPEYWGAYIVEGPPEIKVQDFDDTYFILRERLQRFADHKRANGVGGMDRWKDAQLMMQALRRGALIDVEFWTITMLDEDPALSVSQVPCALWDLGSHNAIFFWEPATCENDHSRFRRSVGGVVQGA
jgi:hypothetical protein